MPARPPGTRRLSAAGDDAALRGFPPELAASFLETGVRCIWTDGSTVLSRGHVVPSVQVVLRGRLRITVPSEPGHEIFFRWQQPGEIVGLTSAVSGRPFPVDAVAFGGCETLQVERDVLLASLAADARLALAAARLLAHYAYDLIDLVAARTEQTLTARVLGVLRHLAQVNGRPDGPGAWVLVVSQADLAAAVGASRQRVNAELRTLEREGLIELGYRQMRVRGIPGSVHAEEH